jgi:hypothetical protein
MRAAGEKRVRRATLCRKSAAAKSTHFVKCPSGYILKMFRNGSNTMIRTLMLGSCISVQGRLVRRLADGRIVVAVGSRQFTGFPPSQGRRASAG